MSKVKKIEPLVKRVLEEKEKSRNDDFLLITEVYYKLHPEITKIPFAAIMLGHKELELPSTESITRARRKIQAEHNELRATKEVQKIREQEEQEYIEYSKS